MKVVVDQLGSISGRTITPESDLVADIGIDSLDNIELVMALEEEFSIEIFDEYAEKAITVQDVINYVRSRVAANTAL